MHNSYSKKLTLNERTNNCFNIIFEILSRDMLYIDYVCEQEVRNSEAAESISNCNTLIHRKLRIK